MAPNLNLADVEVQYRKDQNLKKEDVDKLIAWVETQPHLPKINELQAIHFLHSCFYQMEATQQTVDTFFTRKAKSPELFADLDVNIKSVKDALDIFMMTTIPTTMDNNSVIFLLKLVHSDSSLFTYPATIKLFHMVCMLHLHKYGTSNGFIIILDVGNITLSHLAKVGATGIKSFVNYLQEALPVRMTTVHFVNTMPYMNAAIAMLKFFMKKNLVNLLEVHSSVDHLTEFVPLECLPKDYGGSGKSIAQLHDEMKKKLAENRDFFEWEERQIADESKRVKPIKRWFFS